MNTKRVLVERYVEQVRDGAQYKGYIKIDGTSFDYEIVFEVPVPELKLMESIDDQEKVRRIFQLVLKKDGIGVELTDEEYNFFLQLLVGFVVDFHDNPQTRGSNRGLFGEALRGEGPMAQLGMSAAVGLRGRVSYDFPFVFCEMLSAPKFGCRLA